MVKRAQSRHRVVTTISFPVFDDIRHRILEWLDELETGKPRSIIAPMTDAHARMRRVRGSLRHERMADFLDQSIIAVQAGEPEVARYILLTAMAAFGWPAQFVENVL